jgi:crotonobetainyl-CoA:carnitine CoA-transferase CaiB-like acyl-CoA transferase
VTPSTPRPTADRPLADVRVLAIEQYGAGPYATLVLADLGADVIKIEPPGRGDVGRSVPPYADDGDGLFFQSLNRNKRSVALDLKHPQGRAAFEKLVPRADVVFANARGRSPASLRITYADLAPLNPALVCVFLTGYGREGPRAEEPAYDYIVQALSGMAALGGEPGGPPARAGLSVVDFAAGLAAAVAVLAGVHRARATGVGGDLDTSLLGTALSFGNYLAAWTLARGYVPERVPHGGHPSIVPSQLFETADGWLMVMCQTDAFWRALAERLERPDLAADPRYATMVDRLAHKAPLLADLEATFRTRTTAAWLALLQGYVPVAPVNDLATALADPQVAAAGLLTSYDHPRFGPLPQVAGPVRPSAPPPVPTPGPTLGADTESVLRELADLDDADLAALRAAGAVG